MTSAWGAYFQGIRSRQNPIGRAQPKKIFYGSAILKKKVLKKFPWCSLKNTIFEVHKELSKSYREGTAQKLKSMALPYKTEVWQKVDRILMLMV